MKKFLGILIAVIVAFIIGYIIPTLKVSKLEAKNSDLMLKVESLNSEISNLNQKISMLRDEMAIKGMFLNVYINFENRNFGIAKSNLDTVLKGCEKFLKKYKNDPFVNDLKSFLDSDQSKELKDLVEKGDLKDLKKVEEIIFPLIKY